MIELILNLRIISKIPENGKIRRGNNGLFCVSNKSNYLDKITRFIYGDNRDENIKDIENLIDVVVYTTDETYNSKFYDEDEYNMEYLRRKNKIMRYVVCMKDSIRGLNNLKDTYSADVTCSSKIDIIIDKITNFIEKYKDVK